MKNILSMQGKPPLDSKSQEYLWWLAGATAESRARDDGLSLAGREVRELADSLAKMHQSYTREQIALSIAKILCPGKLKMRWR